MCGIAGYFGTREVPAARVQAGLAALGHRGPDAAGSFQASCGQGRRVLLLHTRLSIIDLDPRANQPMRRGELALAFNGEIYNYRELRPRMEARGEAFRSRSDTEVLLALLACEGLAGLDRCEGMWAFALFDPARGLLLCRDRFGEKPLHLLRTPHGLYFASEIKALAALAGGWPAPDLDYLRRYLVNGYKSLARDCRGYFQGVEQLPARSWLRLDPAGQESSGRYWTPCLEQDPGMDQDEAVAGTRERLFQTMDLRLRADVPLAFCMSGGVDSVSLISVAKRVLDFDVHGFTIAVEDERYTEMDLVRVVVDELGLRHTTVPAETAGFLPRLRALVRAHDAPVATISYYAHALLMEAVAAQGYRVTISGTGADELFTGYYDHHNLFLAGLHGTPQHAAALDAWRKHVAPRVRNPYLQDPDRFVHTPGERGHIYLDAPLLASRLRQPFSEPFFEQDYSGDLLRNRMLNELFHEVVPVLLAEDDLNAMLHALENRSPFLDRSLFEFCARIPSRLLMGDGFNKRVLREAMRGVAPDAVLDNRRKVGFNAPIFAFLDRQDPEVRQEVLAPGPVFDLVRREAVEELLDQPGQLSNRDSKFLFSFLGAKFFLEDCAAHDSLEDAA